MWDFHIQTDKTVMANRPDIVINDEQQIIAVVTRAQGRARKNRADEGNYSARGYQSTQVSKSLYWTYGSNKYLEKYLKSQCRKAQC